jgi:hypothetical protein
MALKKPSPNTSLRPDLTVLLWEDLHKRRAINLFGTPFSGRTRLLEDIKRKANPKTHQCLIIDVKSIIKGSYQSFLEELCTQLEIDWTKIAIHTSLSLKLVVIWGLNTKKKIIFLFNHFDALFEPAKHEFPMAFMNDLNSLKETHLDFFVCCVTVNPHDQSLFKGVDAEISEMSWIDLYPRRMSEYPLTFVEIRAELERLFNTKQAWKQTEKERIVNYIHKHSEPIQIFVALDNNMHETMPYDERIHRVSCFRQNKYPKSVPKPNFFTRFIQKIKLPLPSWMK